MNAAGSKTICVLKGGWSVEREVSLASGANCAAALAQAGFDVREIDVTRDIAALVADLTGASGETPAGAVFNALHGRFGEDGCVQGLLNMLDLPYTHSGVAASATAIDKVRARGVFAAAGITVAEGGHLVARRDLVGVHPMTPPYVIKPRNEGSSVGVEIVTGERRASPGDAKADPDEELLVERYVPGHELTVAVTGDGQRDPLTTLGVTELRPKTGFYDYAHKYTAGKTDHLLPAPIPERVAELAQGWAERAHLALGCRGVSRADFRFDSDTFSSSDPMSESRALVLLEVNTQPGMTPMSLVPEQAAFRGIPFVEFVTWLIERARCD
ncbi:MAG: D-alanine--D-alanine ligase [Alphaproteobacteria bacterium]|nr:D-alanine--D-alanine ligase [Alphaproteobacteria bacterium]